MLKRFLIGLFALAVIVAGAGWWQYRQFLQKPLEFEPQDIVFSLEKGWSAHRLSEALLAENVLHHTYWFNLYLRLSGQSGRLQAGEYLLKSGVTPPELARLFIQGQVTQYKFTIIEGWNFNRLLEELKKSENLEHTLIDQKAAEIMQMLDMGDLHPEGQFLPDTYRFPRGTTDLALLRKANQALRKVLDNEWNNRSTETPLKTSYEALILASIIEKETAAAQERKKIAGVFSLRLKKDMKLQTDPTVIYGMGDAYKGNIRRRDLTTDTPYNTYTRKGLPPTPIAMAGKESIHAAVHPTDGPELYFVSRGDGTHHFSVTFKEHNAAVRKYQLGK